MAMNMTSLEVHSTNCVSTTNIILTIAVWMLTVIANSLILFTFFKNYNMRTATNKVVVNMCVVEIICVMSDMSLMIIHLSNKQLLRNITLCKLTIFMNRLLINVVISSMAAISIDRYINLVQTSLRRPRKLYVIVMISGVWVYGFTTSLLLDVLINSRHSELSKVCDRFPQPYVGPTSMHRIPSVIKSLSVILPYMVIIVVPIQVSFSIRKRRTIQVTNTLVSHHGTPKNERLDLHSYMRSTATAFMLFSLFLGFTMPFFGKIIYALITGQTHFTPTVDLVVFILFRIQGIFLPLVYLLRNRFIFDFLRRRFCFKERCFREKRKAALQTWFDCKQNKSRNVRRSVHANRYKIFYISSAQKEISLELTKEQIPSKKDNISIKVKERSSSKRRSLFMDLNCIVQTDEMVASSQ